MLTMASLMDVKEYSGFFWNERLYVKIADCPYGCIVSGGCLGEERMFLSGLARVEVAKIAIKEKVLSPWMKKNLRD